MATVGTPGRRYSRGIRLFRAPGARGEALALKLEQARRYALSLPEAAEAPHHELSSFRVRGKIFATVPTDGKHLHVFVDEEQREPLIAAAPAIFEKLWWGSKVVGVRVVLANADPTAVSALLYSAWCRKAPKDLVKSFASSQSPQ